jgi:hypothetical protein
MINPPLIELWLFSLRYPIPICAKASHIFKFAECGRVAAEVESSLADGGRS